MLKKASVITVVVTMLVLTGCDPGPNDFSKRSQQDSVNQLAQLTSTAAKELK